ncbi:MAG TPA: AAA family ATPase [Sphingobium sp.]
MRLISLRTENFRCLDSIEVPFDPIYSALSGANNCGKSTLVNALRMLVGEEEDHAPQVEPSFREDFSNWKLGSSDGKVVVSGRFSCDPKSDQSLVVFITKLLSVSEESLKDFEIRMEYSSSNKPEVYVVIDDQQFGGQNADEVRKRLRDGHVLIYHNSPTDGIRARYYGGMGQLSELSQAAQHIINESRQEISKKLKRATAPQQARLQGFIEKLSDKLTVEFQLPAGLAYMPFNLALSHEKAAVPLGNWGSGTQNKTLILLALIRASQGMDAESTTDRLTPMVLIEEPESFLHPSAQSEFGTALIKLAEELNVQVIVATHSVSFLNTDRPSSNILLGRETFRGKPRASHLIPVNAENWMKPFSELLGFADQSFVPWQEAMSFRGKKILLVEGDIDRKYLERMKDPMFGNSALDKEIQIFTYNGSDNLKNESILKLVIDLSEKCVVTCDLDAFEKVKKTISLLGLEKSGKFLTIGHGDGRGCIEDLVPTSFSEEVYKQNPQLVEKLMGNRDDQRSAKSSMKSKMCDYFLTNAKDMKDYSAFVGLAKRLNKLLAK